MKEELLQVGDRVRIWAWGGAVPQWMVGEEGLVVHITRAGNPVARFGERDLTDYYGCFKKVSSENP